MGKCMLAIVAALSVCATLSAGGKTETPQTARYDLTEIGADSGIEYHGDRICLTPDGLLLTYQRSRNGRSFAYLDTSGRKVREFPVAIEYPQVSFTVNRDGAIAALAQDYILDDAGKSITSIKRKVYVFSSTGQKERELDLPDAKQAEGQWSIDTAVASPKGTLYVLCQGQVEVIDPATGAVRPLNSQSYRCMTIDEAGDLILARQDLDTYDTWIEKLRGSDGKQVWQEKYDRYLHGLWYRAKDKSIFVADDSGIRKLDSAGKVKGQLMDGRESGLTGYEWYELAVAIDDANTVYLIAPNPEYRETQTGRATLLYRCTPATGPAPRQATAQEVTISHSYYWDRYLDAAIAAYGKAHPEMRIKVNKVLQQDEVMGTAADDLATTLNTQIMAGNAPDIIYAYHLPWKTYARKGLLADLDELSRRSGTMKIEDYSANIVDGCRVGGKLYVFPVSFMVGPLWANKRLLDEAGIKIDDGTWTLDDFYAIAAKVRKDTNGDGTFEQCALLKTDGPSFFHGYVFPAVGDRFLDRDRKEARFDSPEFVEILEKSKEFVERSNTGNPNDPSAGGDLWSMLKSGSVAFCSEFGITASVGMMEHARTLFGDDVLMLRMPSQAAVGTGFTCTSLFGISRQSRNLDQAWGFLRYLLSEEALLADQNMSGFLVHKGAFEKSKQKLIEYAAEWGLDYGTRKVSSIPQADIDTVEAYVRDLGRVEYRDEELWGIISPELKKYYGGELTAAKAAEVIQNKVEIFLGE